MDQIGRIVALDGENATIELERNRACDKCGICHMGESKKMLLSAGNDIGAEVGQRVLIEIEDRTVLKAGFIVYLIPLLALLAGVGIVYGAWSALDLSGHPDWWAMGIGFLFFALAFIVIRKLEPSWRKQSDYNPTIVRIVEDYEEITDFCGHGDDGSV